MVSCPAGKSVISKHIVQKEVAVISDYQVYYPAAKTTEQSLSDKAMLLSKGVQDMWKLPSGELKGSYSLGVFKDKQRANNLKEQLAEKGVRVKINQREKTNVQWFVDVVFDKAKLKQFQLTKAKSSSCSP